MSEEKGIPTRHSVEISDAQHSGESASDGDYIMPSFLVDRRSSPSEVERKINAIVETLTRQFETLRPSSMEHSEGFSNRSTEGIAASERSRSSGQRSITVAEAARQPRPELTNNTKSFEERHTQHRYKTIFCADKTSCRRLDYMEPKNATNGESDDQKGQVMAVFADLRGRLHTTQAKTELLQLHVTVFRGHQEKYIEFEPSLLYRNRPFQNKLREKKKLQLLFSLLRDGVIEFW